MADQKRLNKLEQGMTSNKYSEELAEQYAHRKLPESTQRLLENAKTNDTSCSTGFYTPEIAHAVHSCMLLIGPLQRIPIYKNDDREMSAQECGNDIADTSTSLVMATVMAKDWMGVYARNFALLIAAFWADGAGSINLLAVAGGPACQLEIKIINAVLLAFGFDPRLVNEPDGVDRRWNWFIVRPGQEFKLLVELRVYHEAPQIAIGMEKLIHPYTYHAKQGRLKRVSIVSCPLKDKKGRNANDLVNQEMGDKLSKMKNRCQRKGFAPPGYGGHENVQKWVAFFKD